MKTKLSIYNLWSKPLDQKFTETEIEYLKKQFPKKKFLIKYGVWKQERKNEKYITFIIDNTPYRIRPCAADRSIEVIATRKITNIEWLEELQNFGCNSRVMQAWNYKYIEQLIKGDKRYGIETPEIFIEYCKKKGYSGQEPQLQIFND